MELFCMRYSLLVSNQPQESNGNIGLSPGQHIPTEVPSIF